MLFFYFKQPCNITDGRCHWIAAGQELENTLSTAVIVYIGMTRHKHVRPSTIQLIRKYQQANDNNVAIIAKKRRVILFYVR